MKTEKHGYTATHNRQYYVDVMDNHYGVYADVTSFIKPANYSTWDSEIDYYGYTEIQDVKITNIFVEDENGNEIELEYSKLSSELQKEITTALDVFSTRVNRRLIMGGNVFPGMNRRYNKDEYLALVDEMTPMFNMIFKVWNVTPTFSDKADFGDMDVVGVTKFTFNVDLLKAVFNLQPFKTHYLIKNNGGVWSLIYKDFQIDLVTCPEHEYEFTKNYMGVGDRGNFVGKIAHMLGLKFGHDGMWLVVRTDDNHQLGEVCLTLNPKEAEAFLDVKPLMDNPKSLEDIFDNVAASKYFNPEVFKLENNNAVARIRDRKRPSYNLFLEYCDNLPEKQWFPRTKDRSIYLPMIFEAFPDAESKYNELWKQKELNDKFKQLLNGNLVQEWLGLTGKELGEMMVILKQHLRPDYVVNQMKTKEAVKEWVVTSYGPEGVYKE